MEQMKWVERKFPHNFDMQYTPLFIERLKSTAPRLEELLNNIDEEKAAIKPNGTWSIKEHAGHLTDLESLHLGRIDDYKADREVLRPADMTNKATNDNNHNNSTTQKLVTDFRESRKHFIGQINQLPDSLFYRRALHPRLQQHISVTDMLHFIAEHDNHHLARIAQIIEQL